MGNWTEPLPKHTILNYEECYTKLLLEELYPKEFTNLKIKDKPDLQMENGRLGIEVTNARDRNDLRAEELYIDIEYNRVRNKDKVLEIINSCGSTIKNGVLFSSSSPSSSFNLILKAFDDKLNKLNGKEYKYFDKNYLAIHSDICAYDKKIIEAVKEMQQRQINREKKFYKVYVLVPEECYILNLYASSYEICRVSSQLQFSLAYKARGIVQ